MTLLLPILLVFLAGFVAPGLQRFLGDRLGPILAVVPAAVFIYFATLQRRIVEEGAIRTSYPWLPSFDIELSFFVDGLSLLFLLIISGIGTFIVLYAAGYLHGSAKLGKFYLYLFSFMGAMLGLVASDNLIVLFVFWELTSITSYLLIGFYHQSETSRKAALQALLVTGAGGLCLLAGLILLGLAGGSFELSTLLENGFELETHTPFASGIFILILLGAFTKSAQFPFHFWLPNAMAAPAPVSAFLHSATMVKAGVFLLARLFPILSVFPAWTVVLPVVGAVTMLTGVVLALGHRDLKKILAYTTVSVLGTLVLLLGLGTELGVKAALTFLLAHALYKASLFMTAGIVDHETGCRDVEQLGGLRHHMPWTAAAALVAALSMAGIPIFLGFLGKEYLYLGLLDAGQWLHWGVGAAFLAAAANFALAIVAGIKPFFGPMGATPKPPHEAPMTMWIGPVLLGAGTILFGLVPALADHWFIGAANIGTLQLGEALKPLALPGLFPPNAALILSLLTFAAGWWLWKQTTAIRAQTNLYRKLEEAGADRFYFRSLAGLLNFALWQTRILQNGYLRYYLMTIVGFAGLLLAVQFLRADRLLFIENLTPVGPLELTAAIMAILGALATCLSKQRINAVIAMGTVGMAIALFFFVYGAPDLAMTQVLVETLTVLIFVLAFYKLPQFFAYSNTIERLRDILLCGVFGLLVSGLVLVALHYQLAEPISEYFLAQSYELAHGRNIVNVILVDFRALDTLGEIAVLAIAAMGVYSMLKLRPETKRAALPKEDPS